MAKVFPQEKIIVRHIYGVGEDGKKKLLYADEIVYTLRNKQDVKTLPMVAFNDGTELLNQRIKLEMFDKSEMKNERPKKTRSE